MSNRILITFGGAAYDHQVSHQQRAMTFHARWKSGLFINRISDVHSWAHKVYDDAWLRNTPFYELNRWIFDRRPQHGFGFCSWKPYIIQHALANFAQQGDVVMYLDGDTYPVADISPLFEYAEREGIMLFEEQGCVNETWVKRECMEAMGADAESLVGTMHACGRFQLFRKGDHRNNQFLQEWQTYSLNRRCQFHEGSRPGVPDHPSFIKNSCEQSVLSVLAHNYGIPLHRTPDQNGWPVAHDGKYKPEDTYPQLFFQDGSRGNINDLSGSRYRNV